MFVVFDLDGTIANCEHRLHHIDRHFDDDGNKTKPNWRAFFAACADDTPIEPIIQTCIAMKFAGHRVEIWSGRSDECRDQTWAWLGSHDLGEIPLRMRKAGDHRQDFIVKSDWLDETGMPDLIFDDRASVVSMWRERGILCCQVAPGDF